MGRAKIRAAGFALAVLATAAGCGGSTSDSSTSNGVVGGDASADATGNVDSGTSDSAAGDAGASDAAGNDASDASPFDGGGRVPVNHRPDDSQCQKPAATGNCTLQQASCTQDSQCTSGTNGRCVQTMGGALTCLCTYDTCVHDSDCPAGKLCACHGSAYTGGTGNTCIDGNCRVDADCGAGKYCSPSHGTSGCGGVTGYYCHTAQDQCIDDADCGGGVNVCAWSASSNRWTCQQEQLCP
jgi:hypothetical protein